MSIRSAPAAVSAGGREASPLLRPGAVVALVRRHPGVVLAGLASAAWLAWNPRSPDLAGQVYRVTLYGREGFALWDDNWFAGHHLPGYSLTFGPLATLIGMRVAGVLCVLVSALAFERLVVARAALGEQAERAASGPVAHTRTARGRLAGVLFALVAAGDLYIGRLTFALGVTFALLAVLAAMRARIALAALAAALCAASSPVAALFLALVGVADALANRCPRRALALIAPALAVVLGLATLFPEGGRQPFARSSLLAAVAVSLAVLWLLPRRERALRAGVALYVLALAGAYVLDTPMGSNSVRLGVLLGAPLLALAADPRELRLPRGRCAPPLVSAAALALAGLAATAWALNGPLRESLKGVGDRSVEGSYYTPVAHYLAARPGPLRVEVPFTRAHWDATVLGARFSLARGWERQLDTKYDALFFRGRLTPAAYRAWLATMAVGYVALPDARLDSSSRQEGTLIRAGLPYLRRVFGSAHWVVYAVEHPRALADGPGRLVALGHEGFTLDARAPGSFTVRVRYTPYWALTGAPGCVSGDAQGWTRVSVPRAGRIDVGLRFALDRVLDHGVRCRGA